MRLPHEDVGEGPAVLLLHAGIADRRMWSEHLQPLAAAGFRVVAPDLPEFGEASAPSEEYAPWNEVLATMDALGIERATLVGNSLGGAVALRIAVLAPQRVDALTLISAPAPGIEPALLKEWLDVVEGLWREPIDQNLVDLDRIDQHG